MSGRDATISSLIQSHGGHVPEDKIQYLVETPYGRGMTIRTRQQEDGIIMREIELLDWKQQQQQQQKQKESNGSNKEDDDNDISEPFNASAAAQAIQQAAEGTTGHNNRSRSRPAVLYSCADYPSVTPVVGDSVMTPYGRGIVTDIQQRGNTNIHVVVLSSWRLSNRHRVTCYLNPQDIKKIRHKKLYEMNVYEKVEYSAELKLKANQQFGNKRYGQALQLYAKAIDAVRYVQHNKESDNHVRADLLQFMITCSNNAGTCCTQLSISKNTRDRNSFYHKQALQYAQNALVLLKALEQGQTRSPRILSILRKEYQLTDAKLFGQWTVKSYLIQAQANLGLLELDDATTSLEQARKIVQHYTSALHADQSKDVAVQQQLLNYDKEIKVLLLKVKEKKRVILQKEKLRAQAMFGGNANNNASSEKKSNGNNGQNTRTTAMSQTTTTTSAALASSGNSPSSQHSPREKNQAPQRRVSFNETVKQYHIPHKDDDKEAAEQQAAEDLPWYHDADLMLGLTLFGIAALAAAYATSIMAMGRGGPRH